MSSRGNVSLTTSSAANESFLIEKNVGTVLVPNRCDLNLSLVDNGALTLRNDTEALATSEGVSCDGNGNGFELVSVV